MLACLTWQDYLQELPILQADRVGSISGVMCVGKNSPTRPRVASEPADFRKGRRIPGNGPATLWVFVEPWQECP